MIKYFRNSELETVSIGEEIGMLNIETGNYYVLDSISSDIWQILDKVNTIDEIVTELKKSYDVSETECKSDVLELLDDLENKKIVKKV